MTLALISDPHFDHIRDRAIRGDFKRALRASGVDAIVMTGDIAEAATFAKAVRNVGDDTGLPVYYVLGNHDLYGGSIAEVHRAAWLAGHWLGAAGVDPVDLGNGRCLVGVDGWYDFRTGRGPSTRIAMNDWYRIHDFRPLSAGAIVAASRALAEQSAELATKKLQAAVQAGYTRILLATHVPPFVECATHEGQPSDPDWAAIMVNVTLGDALFAFATEHRDVTVDVLCGHTHDRCDRMVAPNLRVRSGERSTGGCFSRCSSENPPPPPPPDATPRSRAVRALAAAPRLRVVEPRAPGRVGVLADHEGDGEALIPQVFWFILATCRLLFDYCARSSYN